MNICMGWMMFVAVLAMFGSGIYSNYALNDMLNNNAPCVIERLEREVIDADGRVSINDLKSVCR